MYLHGLWGWRPLKWQTMAIHVAVRLPAKGLEQGLGLRPRLTAGLVSNAQCH